MRARCSGCQNSRPANCVLCPACWRSVPSDLRTLFWGAKRAKDKPAVRSSVASIYRYIANRAKETEVQA